MKFRKEIFLLMVIAMISLAGCHKTKKPVQEDNIIITFDTDGGEVIEPLKFKGPQEYKISEQPSKDKHIFRYWTLNGKEIGDTINLQSSITLKAKWINMNDTFNTIKFKSLSGEVIASKIILPGEEIGLLPTLEKEGKIFIGWFRFGKEISPNDIFNKSIQVDAKYIDYIDKKFNVVFKDSEGNTLKEEVVNAGMDATPPKIKSKEGIDFKGWDKDYRNVVDNIEVTAILEKWTYVVKFLGEDGNVISEQNVKYKEDAVVPIMEDKAGHIFAGWNKKTNNVTMNMTVKSIWVAHEIQLNDDEKIDNTVNTLLKRFNTTVTKNIDLPSVDSKTNTKMVWKSLNKSVIEDNGVLHKNDKMQVATISATMTSGKITREETFDIKISRFYKDLSKGVSSGYFYRTSSISDEAIETLDVFILAFSSFDKNGNFTSLGKSGHTFVNKYLDRIHKKGGRVLLSFINPDPYVAVASDPIICDKFARNLVDILNQYDLDGIDIDWERKVGTDAMKIKYVSMIKTLHKYIKGNNEDHLLISTVGGGPYAPNKFSTADYQEYIDYLNLMTYGMQIGYSRHQGALYYAAGSVASGCSVDDTYYAYKVKGVPSNKIVVGIAFFGQRYEGSNGIGTKGTNNNGYNATTYRRIYDDYISNPENQKYVFFDNTAKVPYIYDSKEKLFITYEDPQSIKLKCEYVKKKGMAGVMFWQYGQDNGNLLHAIAENQKIYKGE